MSSDPMPLVCSSSGVHDPHWWSNAVSSRHYQCDGNPDACACGHAPLDHDLGDCVACGCTRYVKALSDAPTDPPPGLDVAAHAPTGPAGPDEAAERYGVINGWLFEYVNEHTCGTEHNGHYGAHEPGCGQVPIGKVEGLLSVAAATSELRERIEAAIDELQALPECWYGGYVTVRRTSVHAMLRALASPARDDAGGAQ